MCVCVCTSVSWACRPRAHAKIVMIDSVANRNSTLEDVVMWFLALFSLVVSVSSIFWVFASALN